MDPEDKAMIEGKLKSVEGQVEKVKKSGKAAEDAQLAKEAYDLERYKNSKLFQKFMKQEGVSILQKPPVSTKPKGPSPPPYQESPPRDEEPIRDDLYEEYDEEPINDRVAFSPEPNVVERATLQKSESTDVELEGYSEHIPPSPARAQMFSDPRASFNPPVQPPPMYQTASMYPPYYYQQPNLGMPQIPQMAQMPQIPGIPQMAGLPQMPGLGMLPPLEMQLYFKQMMDMYQQSAPPSAREPVRDTSKDAELEAKDKEIRRLQKEIESCKLDIMQLEDQLNDQASGGPPAAGDDRKVQELMRELENMQKRYDATEDELISTQRECDKVKDELVALKAKKQVPVEDTQSIDKIVQLEFKLEGAIEKAAILEKALAKEKDINAEAERRMEVARNRIAKMDETIEDLKAAVQAKGEELDENKREFMQQMRKMQKDMEILRNEADSLRNQNERLQAQKAQPAQPARPVTRDPYGRSPERDTQSPFESRRPQKPARRDDYYESEYTEPPRREYAEEPQRLQRPQSTYEPDYDPPPPASARRREDKSSTGLTHFDQIRSVENKLITVQMERDRVQIEYNKIPEHSKTISQRKRREQLEQELEILNSNINSLKSKMRTLTNSKS